MHLLYHSEERTGSLTNQFGLLGEATRNSYAQSVSILSNMAGLRCCDLHDAPAPSGGILFSPGREPGVTESKRIIPLWAEGWHAAPAVGAERTLKPCRAHIYQIETWVFSPLHSQEQEHSVRQKSQHQVFPIIVENLVDIKMNSRLIPLNSAAYAFCISYVATSNA